MTAATARRLQLQSLCLVGLGVGGGIYGVLTGRHRLDSVGDAVSILFGGLVCAIYAGAFARTGKLLDAYAREEEALPACTDALGQAAELEREVLKPRPALPELESASAIAPPAQQVTVAIALAQLLKDKPVPLLRVRLDAMMRTLRRGSPIVAQPDDTDPTSAVRADVGIVLGLGLGGTLLSLFLSFAAARDSELLLSRAALGLFSIAVAAAASAALRLCQTAVVGRHEEVSLAVDRTLAENFLQSLPKTLTSSEERLTITVQKLLNSQVRVIHGWMKDAVEPTLRKMAEQTEVLTTHAGELSKQSASWSKANAELQIAHRDFLLAQKKIQEEQDQRLETLFTRFGQSSRDIEAAAEAARARSLLQAQQYHLDLQTKQSAFLKALLATLNQQFASLMDEHASASRTLTDESMERFGNAIAERTAAVESTVAAALNALGSTLPEVLRASLQTALSGALELVDVVREQAGTIAQAVSQVSQNADRQLRAYEEWADRAKSLQAQQLHILDETQRAQERMVLEWQRQSAEIFSQITARLDRSA